MVISSHTELHSKTCQEEGAGKRERQRERKRKKEREREKKEEKERRRVEGRKEGQIR
jgi:hypothetical protein